MHACMSHNMLWRPLQQPVICPQVRGQPILFALFAVRKPQLSAPEEEWGGKWATVGKKRTETCLLFCLQGEEDEKCPVTAPKKMKNWQMHTKMSEEDIKYACCSTLLYQFITKIHHFVQVKMSSYCIKNVILGSCELPWIALCLNGAI